MESYHIGVLRHHNEKIYFNFDAGYKDYEVIEEKVIIELDDDPVCLENQKITLAKFHDKKIVSLYCFGDSDIRIENHDPERGITIRTCHKVYSDEDD